MQNDAELGFFFSLLKPIYIKTDTIISNSFDWKKKGTIALFFFYKERLSVTWWLSPNEPIKKWL